MPSSLLSDSNLTFFAAIGLAIGFILFLKELKKSFNIPWLPGEQKILNTTTPHQQTKTKVAFSGKIIAEDGKLKTAPLSGRKCALYHIQLGESNLEDIFSDIVDEYFSDEGFLLEDQSGALALVLMKGAEFDHKEEPEIISPGTFDCPNLPGPVLLSLQANKHKLTDCYLEDFSWIIDESLQIAEWCFIPGEQIHILAFADKLEETQPAEKSEDLAKLLEGTYSKEKLNELIPRIKMIFKNNNSDPFVISKRSGTPAQLQS